MICNSIVENFNHLCSHQHSTYFVQKIVKLFPMKYLSEFYAYIKHDFVWFCKDKNGMCVLKYLMKRLGET